MKIKKKKILELFHAGILNFIFRVKVNCLILFHFRF